MPTAGSPVVLSGRNRGRADVPDQAIAPGRGNGQPLSTVPSTCGQGLGNSIPCGENTLNLTSSSSTTTSDLSSGFALSTTGGTSALFTSGVASSPTPTIESGSSTASSDNTGPTFQPAPSSSKITFASGPHTSSSSVNAPGGSSANAHTGSNAGIIAGGVVGGILGFTLIVGCIVYIICRRNRQKYLAPSAEFMDVVATDPPWRRDRYQVVETENAS